MALTISADDLDPSSTAVAAPGYYQTSDYLIGHAIDHFARGQVGWWYSDGDGVLDPVDVEPKIAVRLNAADGCL